MTSGYDFSKRNVLRRWRNIDKDCADVIYSGNRFQIRGPATLRPCCIHGGITSYDITLCVGFFQTMIIRWTLEILLRILVSTTPYIIHVYAGPDACPRLHVVLQVILARKWLRMQIAHKLQKFLGGDAPNPALCYDTGLLCFQIPTVLAHTTFR